MNISIFGLGYVGCVSLGCFAKNGHNVIGVDVSDHKVNLINQGRPTIIEKDGKLFLVVGSPGGSTIPTTVFQVIVNILDFGMNVQDAVNAGRFHHQWLPDYLSYEKKSIDSATVKKLESIGHILKVRNSIGLVNAIQILADGKKEGGADPRGYNVASGF